MLKREKRKPIICPNCHTGMVCMNRFESIYKLIRGFYVWYICPRRKGEDGCGQASVLRISPETRRPQKIVSKAKFKKGKTRKKE